MNNRVLPMILSSALMLSLPACSVQSDGMTATVTDTEAVASESQDPDAAVEDNLPEKNYDGYTFNILTHIVGTKLFNNEHIYIESENGETLNDAIYRRNLLVEERFNIKITETIATGIKNTFTNSVMAGDNDFDCAVIQNGNIPDFQYMSDLLSMPYIDLTMPWWDQNIRSEQSIGGKLYLLYGDMLITHTDPLVPVFYNQKLAEQFKLDDLYSMVRDGSWTMDKFNEAGKPVTMNLNGDSVFDDRDRYAYTSLKQNSFVTWMIAGGAEYTSKNSDDLPILSIDNEKFYEVFDKIESILTQPNFVYDPRSMTNTGTDGDSAIIRLFAANQALFFTHGLGTVNQFRDMEADYGLLPMPKYDESQKNYINTLRSEKYLMVPVTIENPERCGIIIEAMAAEGHRTLIPKYYESMIKNKYLRDEESIEMLDQYIIPNLSCANAFGITKITAAFQNMFSDYTANHNLASFIASNKSAFQAEIDKVIASAIKNN